MKRICGLLVGITLCGSASAQEKKPERPPIISIAQMRILTTVPSEAVKFYGRDLGLPNSFDSCVGKHFYCFEVNGRQRLNVLTSFYDENGSRISEILFETSDILQLRDYLLSKNVKIESLNLGDPSKLYMTLHDPEDHRIGFIQYVKKDGEHHVPNQVSTRLIHAGFIVKDRAAEDQFYKDILGFRPYWHGGMKDDETNWVSLQVPDGSDWLEYMLNVPADANQHLRGVMNHIALGVTDIQAAKTQLLKNGWKPTEEPKLGRDGKWQLNVYDPDDTRVEFMEFTPKEKPCCSEFTGPHPKP